MDYMGASLRWPIITQPLTHVNRSLRHGNTEMHRLVSLNELQTRILNIELHIYCGLNTKLLHVQNTALWHMLLHLYKYFLSDDFPTKLSRITTEWNNPLLVVFRKYRMLIFLKMKLPTTASYVDLPNFIMEILSSLIIYIKISHVSRDLLPWTITMIGGDASLDVNTSAPVPETHNTGLA